MMRETAWKMFSGELNSSNMEKKSEEEKAPSYLITPLGAMVNRVLVAGVLIEKENTGTDEEPMWRGRVQDLSGNYFISAGRFQPEAAASLADMEVPSFVAMTGKVRTYTVDDGRVFVSLRPEKIVSIDEATRNRWVLETSQFLWKRLLMLKTALRLPDASTDAMIAKGIPRKYAEGINIALDHYGTPESGKYLKMIQTALRALLPDKDIDLGLPSDVTDVPDEIDIDVGNGTPESAEKEDVILRLIEQLESDNRKGAPRDELERLAGNEGISPDEVEQISDSLMDKGMIYEPDLGYLRRI